jgi:glycosyltransferase involved in cell wall biosynthesis
VESALRQTFTELEILVVDDASQDRIQANTPPFSDPKVKCVFVEEQAGGAASRNVGIALSRGIFVAFLDDDDEWSRERLSEQLPALQQNPSAGVAYCREVWRRSRTVLRTNYPVHQGNVFPYLMLGWCPSSTSNFIVRKTLLERHGFDERLPGLQDYDLWLSLSMHTEFLGTNRYLVIFDQTSPNRVSRNIKKRLLAIDLIEEKWSNKAAERGLERAFKDTCDVWRINVLTERETIFAKSPACPVNTLLRVAKCKRLAGREKRRLLLRYLVGMENYGRLVQVWHRKGRLACQEKKGQETSLNST